MHSRLPDGWAERCAGLIIGGAVGDALGLPREGVSPRRAVAIWGDGPVRHALVFGRGMCSDDTELTCITGQAWLASGGSLERFERELALRLRWWFALLPAAVGRATAAACIRLWLGWRPANAGARSAGNGAAMRAAILAVCIPHDESRLIETVRRAAGITHRDVRAIDGAVAVALVARAALFAGDSVQPRRTLQAAASRVESMEIRESLLSASCQPKGEAVAPHLGETWSPRAGVSGYVVHTVRAALHCWAAHPSDFRAAIDAAVRLGGDTDSVAAIVGNLSGATVGLSRLPREWREGVCEWPRSIAWMERLAEALSAVAQREFLEATRPISLRWSGLIPRNAAFFTIVLAHALRRALPPYGQ
ncbi:MAG: ADP-ribosylglycohydrolase family protein [Phycisphaerae bacterium]|nr:ADP-ribosylglycohydrolase family protein [Phycisphaerae bacterium]